MSNQLKFDLILNSSAKNICVMAGPGSGKTRGVIIPKTQQLIQKGIDTKEILLLSFSRISAQDLKKKATIIGSKLRACTVHSFCLIFLLSENNHDIRQRIESVIFDFEKNFLIADLQLLFPNLKKTEIKKMLNRFSAGWAESQQTDLFEHNEEEKRFKLSVINWLQENQAAMMEEIVYFAVDLAKKLPEAPLLKQYKYILIDEYQDLNKLEQEFVDLLGKKSELLLVVGDPDQSIYSFKFAHPDGIKNLALNNKVDNYFLEYCGRCSTKILAVANQLLIQDSPLRTELPLPLSGKEEGEVNVSNFKTQELEFDYVLNSIIDRFKNGAKPTDIIILVPKKKLGEEFFEQVKNSEEIKNLKLEFKLIQKLEFSEEQQKKILLLSLLAKPESLVHLRSYLGLGDKHGFAEEIKTVKEKYGGIKEFLHNVTISDSPSGRSKILYQNAIELRSVLTEYKHKLPLEKIVDDLFSEQNSELLKLNHVLKKLIEKDDTIDSLYYKFLENIKELPEDLSSIKIMSIMESKGLEAEHVYILGCNRGNLPGKRRNEHQTDIDHIKEQRRLLYVGFTRAKKSLTVTWCMYIPYSQSLNHYTSGLSTITVDGKKVTRLGMSQFLQDIN